MNRKYTVSTMTGIALLFFTSAASAQFLKNLKNQVKETVRQTVEQRAVEKAGTATNTAIDKTAEAAGKEVKKVVAGNKNEEEIDGLDAGNELPGTEDAITPSAASTAGQPVYVNYKSYDFVPGDRIIFQPDLSGEADAELPARFAVKKGNAEIQSHEGEKILHLDEGGHVMVTPLMDNDHYLPEQFTLEFDMMYENPRQDYFASVNDFRVRFYSAEDSNYDGYGLAQFLLHSNERVTLGDNQAGSNVVNSEIKQLLNTNNVWHRIAIYIRNNIAKAYIDGSRVSATNVFPAGAARLAIQTDGNYGFKIKNFRLAAGGDDKYNKIITEGKFITHGILFDVAKSTIKPESMGTINEVTKMMKDHPDLRFEIRGHTDSDGAEEANVVLSQQRADAVRAALTASGIDESRLSAKGFGESEPMDTNDTAEGKANNRRVEFVKM